MNYLSRFQNSNLKERGFSYPRKSNSSGGLESPPSVSFESSQGSFEITSPTYYFEDEIRVFVFQLWQAVIAATPIMSSTEQPLERSFTGFANPWRIGP